MARAAWLFLVLALSGAVATPAEARRTETHSYRYDQLWRSIVRLVRVDYGFNVRDRDEDIGYVIFDYVDGGRSYPASIELVRTREAGNEQVRVTVNVPAMPSYVERMILDRLTRKLREEYGQPVVTPVARPTPAESEDEDDEDAGEDDDS
ncbi:MAG: hypothetical protein AAF411_11135 [Myxococcota bacterium]